MLKTLRAIVLATLLALGMSSLSPVAAYPPAEEISISTNKLYYSPGESMTVVVTNAVPGLVRITAMGSTRRVFTSSGSVTVAFKLGRAGASSVSVRDSEGNTASTTVYVASANFPKTVKVGQYNVASIRGALPGSRFSVSVTGASYSMIASNDIVSSSGTAGVSIRFTRTGTATVRIFLNGTLAGTYNVRITR